MASPCCRVHWCLNGKGQVKEMRLWIFHEGSNCNYWTDRQWQVVQKRQSTRVKSSCTCVGLNLGIADTDITKLQLFQNRPPAWWQSLLHLLPVFHCFVAFCSHISVVCNSCFYHMRDLRRIRRHVDLDSATLLATALVSSRLDYCNSLLYGIADIDLTRLQRVQNQLARMGTKSPPFTRSIPLLRSLHWLPVRFRILFQINLLTYKTLREKHPVNLHSMLAASIPSRSLRSNNDNSLSVPRVKTNTGARAFYSCAPSLWNNLPLSVRSASSVATSKKYVKTHLFDLAFLPWIPSLPMACWCYGTVSSILLLNTDLAVAPLSLPSPGILAL